MTCVKGCEGDIWVIKDIRDKKEGVEDVDVFTNTTGAETYVEKLAMVWILARQQYKFCLTSCGRDGI